MAFPNDVTKKDLRIERTRGSGAGGQNRNKRDTAVRITHIPTGLVGYSEDQRTQGQNQKIAFRRLVDKLVPIMKNEQKKQRYTVTQEIRTYHEPDNRVRDYRIEGKQWQYTDVLFGNALDGIIDENVRGRM